MDALGRPHGKVGDTMNKSFRVMVCEEFIEVEAKNEEDAEQVVRSRLLQAQWVPALIVWEK